MKRFTSLMVAGIALGFVLHGCSTAPPGSKEEAVNTAWNTYCKAGYCEGYSGRIVSRTDDTLTVTINRNTRYIWYAVSGEPENFTVNMHAKCDHGKINKTIC